MSMDGLQRNAAWIVRDLALPTPRLGGSGTDAFASHFATGDYQLHVMDTLARVLFDPSPSDPVGGSDDLTLTVQRTRQGATPADRSRCRPARWSSSDYWTVIVPLIMSMLQA